MEEHGQKQVTLSASQLVYDRKFDVAIRKSHCLAVVNRVVSNKLSVDDKFLDSCYKKLTRDNTKSLADCKINSNCYPRILKLTLDTKPTNRSKKQWDDIQALIHKNVNIQIDWMTSQCDRKMKPGDLIDAMFSVNNITRTNEVWSLLTIFSELDSLVDKLPNSDRRIREGEDENEFLSKKINSCIFRFKYIPVSLCWSARTCVIIINDVPYMVPKPYCLMIHNKICDLISVSILFSFTPSSIYGCEDLPTILFSFLRALIKLAIKYDQDYFHIAKVLEGLVIGETLIQYEGQGNASFLKTLEDGLLESLPFHYQGSEIEGILSSVSTPLRHELGCLSKILGHPFCDVKQGASDLHKKTTEERVIVPELVTQSVRYAKKDFLDNYIARHGRWPPIRLVEGALPAFAEAQRLKVNLSNRRIVNRYGPTPIIAYDDIELLPVKEFDYIENFIPYIKDRTVSLLKNKVFTEYLSSDESSQKMGMHEKWKQTRLLLIYLLFPNDKTDHMMYLQEYIAGNWEQIMNYLVIRLVPKEKELKISARGFGCKSHQDRARSIIQEHNTAHFLSEYSHEEGMTLPEIPLAMKLYSFRHLSHAYPNHVQISINVDSSSWNNRFRHAAVAPLEHDTLDKIYDVPIFSKTHEAFQHTLLYMPDQDEVYSWEGQEGGIEGLNQYTWVHVYIHQIKVCMEEFAYPYHILCKGDDLRVAVLVPPNALEHRSVENIKQQILEALQRVGAGFGHIIKAEDSYGSQSYFAFSKNAYALDVEMPQTARKGQKAYGANNAFMTCLDDYIAASFSNCHSTSKTGPSPVSAYCLALFWSFLYMNNHPIIGKLKFNEKVALSLVPNLLGGFPIIYLHNFFVRAESDLLPPFIDLVQFMYKNYPEVFEYTIKFFSVEVSDPKISFLGFLSDGYSLCIKRPKVPQTILRQHIAKIIKKKTKNEKIKELMELVDDEHTEAFVSSLLSANVYDAKILGALYDASPLGIVAELVRKFESGRSIMDAIILHAGHREANKILRKVQRVDQARNTYRFKVIRRNDSGIPTILPNDWLSKCSTEIAQNLRDTTWGKPVQSVTQPCLQHVLKIGQVDSFGSDMYAAQNHFEYFFNINFTNKFNHHPLFTATDRRPFLGGTTGTGLAAPEARLIDNNIIALKLHKLLDLVKWVNKSVEVNGEIITSNLPTLIINMIETYSGRPFAELSPFTAHMIRNRTVHHHVPSKQYKVSTVPNTLDNIYTRVVGNSHSHLNFSITTDHFKINFLHCYCYVTSLWALRMFLGDHVNTIDRLWAVTCPCNYCLQPIQELPIVIDDRIFPHVDNIVLTEIGNVALTEIMKNLDEYEAPDYVIREEEDEELLLQEAIVGLVQHFLHLSWRSRQVLQDRFTHHHLTTDGIATLDGMVGHKDKNKISAEDLRHISADDIFEGSKALIYSFILKAFPTTTENSVLEMISTVPGEELPWSSFIRNLSEANRLYDIQLCIMRKIPQLSTSSYDNWITFVAVYGAACYMSCSIGDLTDFKVPYLSHLKEDNFEREFHYKVELFQWSHIMREYIFPFFSLPNITPNSVAIKTELVISAMSLAINYQNERTYRGLEHDLELKRIVNYHLFSLEPLDEIRDEIEERYQEGLLSSNQFMLDILSLVGEDYYYAAIIEMMEETERFVNVYNELAGRPGLAMITVYKTNPIECLNRTREDHAAGLMPIPRGMEGRGIVARINPIHPENINFVRCRLFTASAVIDPFVGEKDFPVQEIQNELHFNERWKERPVGSNNISMSRLASVLSHIGIRDLPEFSTYLCAGDGYGGYTSVISALTNNSVIHYNTFPNHKGIIPQALIADQIATQNHNVVDSTNIQYGHYDLSLESTWEFFSDHIGEVTVVTNDAEALEIRGSSAFAMVDLTCKFFCSKSVRGGLLIYKLYTTPLDLVQHAITVLRQSCTSIYILQGPASPTSGEIFLVAQSAGHMYAEQMRIGEHKYPPAHITRSLIRFVRGYNGFVTRDVGGTNELVFQKNYPHVMTQLIRTLPLFGWSKLQEVGRVIVPLEFHRRGNLVFRRWIILLKNIFHEHSVFLHRELVGALQYNKADLYNTLTHKVVILKRWLILKASWYVLDGLSRDENFVLTRRGSEQHFIACLRTAPWSGLYIHIPDDELFNYDTDFYGIKISFYKHWMLGLRWITSSIIAGRNT